MEELEENQISNNKAKRIPELDGIRGMAILLVLAYHYISVSIPPDAGPGFLFVRQIFSKGWSGVDLFFVLSGFLITGILIDKRDSKNYFKIFYFRRINRIFPLYFFFLLVFFVIQKYESSWGIFSPGLFSNTIPFSPYLLFLQNFTMALHGTFGNEYLAVTWSLAIEEQFYLILPLLVRFSHPKRLPLNFIFFISIPLILRATIGSGGHFGFVLTPWRMDSLFLGSLLAVIIRSSKIMEFIQGYIIWVKSALLLIFIFLLCGSFTEEVGTLNHLFTFGLFYTILLFLAIIDKKFVLSRILRNKVLKIIGTISFGIYIFHQFINGFLHDLIFKKLPSFHDLPSVLVTFLAVFITILLSTGTYHAFEKRFVSFGHKFNYKNK